MSETSKRAHQSSQVSQGTTMQTLLSSPGSRTEHHAVLVTHARSPDEAVVQEPAEPVGTLPTGHGFAALLKAFRDTGGTARGGDVGRLLEDYGLGNFIGIARLISSGAVFGFEWRSTLWIPMFQFDLRDLSVRPAARGVLAELGEGFDGWQRAVWFSQPNGWLHDQKPMDVFETDLSAVLNAARADRFVAAC